MSLRAINEIVVHLESFRNIELWYQGLYFISIEIAYIQAIGQVTKVHRIWLSLWTLTLLRTRKTSTQMSSPRSTTTTK